MRFAGVGLAAAVLATALLGAWAADEPRATEQQKYVVVDLGTSGGSESSVWGLNNYDEVVGETRDEHNRPVAFLWQNEKVTRLKLPSYATRKAAGKDITDDGVILGTAGDGGWTHSLVWADAEAAPKDIGALGGPTTDAYCINRSRAVVGNSRLANAGMWCPYVWRDGKMTKIETPSGGGGVAFGINDKGDVVGDYSAVPGRFDNPFRAFLWSGGVARDIGTLGGEASAAASINNAGRIVGNSSTSKDGPRGPVLRTGREAPAAGAVRSVVLAADAPAPPKDGPAHPFLWVDGKMQDLGTLGGSSAGALRINEAGVIIGESDLPGDKVRHAFLWRDGKMTDLNARLEPDSGWVLLTASDINDHGCIVGLGLHNGKKRGYLLKPLGHDIPRRYRGPKVITERPAPLAPHACAARFFSATIPAWAPWASAP